MPSLLITHYWNLSCSDNCITLNNGNTVNSSLKIIRAEKSRNMILNEKTVTQEGTSCMVYWLHNGRYGIIGQLKQINLVSSTW